MRHSDIGPLLSEAQECRPGTAKVWKTHSDKNTPKQNAPTMITMSYPAPALSVISWNEENDS